MKSVRLFLAVSFISGLAVSQVPSVVQCQMSMGALPGVMCSMPCCKAQRLPIRCPQVRVAVHPDLIRPALVEFSEAMEQASIAALLPAQPLFKSESLQFFVVSLLSRFIHFRSAGRAPPLDSIDLAA